MELNIITYFFTYLGSLIDQSSIIIWIAFVKKKDTRLGGLFLLMCDILNHLHVH